MASVLDQVNQGTGGVPLDSQLSSHAVLPLQAAMAAAAAEAEVDVTAFADAAAAAGLASDLAAQATMAQRLGLQVQCSTTVVVMRETQDCMSLFSA
jgi:hypothetical protein